MAKIYNPLSERVMLKFELTHNPDGTVAPEKTPFILSMDRNGAIDLLAENTVETARRAGIELTEGQAWLVNWLWEGNDYRTGIQQHIFLQDRDVYSCVKHTTEGHSSYSIKRNQYTGAVGFAPGIEIPISWSSVVDEVSAKDLPDLRLAS